MRESHKYKFVSHIPNFFDGFKPHIIEFDAISDLLENPLIFDIWGNGKPGDQFYRFSKSDNRLMAEYNNGYNWYVLGSLSNSKEIDLPEWKAKYTDESLFKKELEKIKNDVIQMCSWYYWKKLREEYENSLIEEQAK